MKLQSLSFDYLDPEYRRAILVSLGHQLVNLTYVTCEDIDFADLDECSQLQEINLKVTNIEHVFDSMVAGLPSQVISHLKRLEFELKSQISVQHTLLFAYQFKSASSKSLRLNCCTGIYDLLNWN